MKENLSANKAVSRKEVDVYVDGSCRGNPGRGDWGAILVYKGIEKELSGGEPHTTNNRMELSAVIAALNALKEPCRVCVTSDSRYVVDAINNGWLENWRTHGWKKSDRTTVQSVDLWTQLLELLKKHEVTFV